MESKQIRNFCIIAHIDHGKSTLADRFLEITGTVQKRAMREQLLDQMDLERERGITIKLQPVAMNWQGYLLNLIDTPGHVDFTYEVSRSLQAVEGAILLVDATQGVQAQTIANYELARQQGLTIIPVINKVDLPAADVPGVSNELVALTGLSLNEILQVSAKSGQGVEQLLRAVINKIPPPLFNPGSEAQALIFDSFYDDFRGVVAAVRVVNGVLTPRSSYQLLGSKARGEILELGVFRPQLTAATELDQGQIGYVVTGLKDIRLVRVGDTLAGSNSSLPPLPGYREVKPMVYAGLYPASGDDGHRLRDALGKLKLNDASLLFEPENSPALGFGFRCGFLGLLHLEITQERLKREYNLEIIITTPSVAYEVYLTNQQTLIVRSALELPTADRVRLIKEPMVQMDIVTPTRFLGNLMSLAQEFRGVYVTTDYLNHDEQTGRAILKYIMPLSAILVDFYDQVKSVSTGYASLNYEFIGYEECRVQRLDILVAEEPVEALAVLVYQDEAYRRARNIVTKLKDSLPRQMFEVKLQASIGGKIIASERISAMRKDVTGYLYGGDVTRKRKLLEKQKRGKKRMREIGKVIIPPETYLALVSRPRGK